MPKLLRRLKIAILLTCAVQMIVGLAWAEQPTEYWKARTEAGKTREESATAQHQMSVDSRIQQLEHLIGDFRNLAESTFPLSGKPREKKSNEALRQCLLDLKLKAEQISNLLAELESPKVAKTEAQKLRLWKASLRLEGFPQEYFYKSLSGDEERFPPSRTYGYTLTGSGVKDFLEKGKPLRGYDAGIRCDY